MVPGLAETMPEISPDGKTYKLTLRPNMKYSDGTPIKASDFTYAIQRLFKADSGGSVFYDAIVGAKDYAAGTADTITGITTDDTTGDITIAADGAQRHLRESARPDVRRAGAADHAVGRGRHQQSAARQRTVHDQQRRRPAQPDDGTQSEVPDRQGCRRQTKWPRRTSTRSPSRRTRTTARRSPASFRTTSTS